MGVYIKGMKMPKNCASCDIEQEVVYADETGFPYIGAHRCPLVYPSYTDESRYEGLLPNCPLTPVPPHGDLVDRDEMREIAISLLDKAVTDQEANAIRKMWSRLGQMPVFTPAEEE